MAEQPKGSFGAQVAAVALILVICVLCFPMPGGGLLITRLSGTEYVPEIPPPPPEPAPVEIVTAPAVPAPPEAPPDPAVRFNSNLSIYAPEDDPLAPPGQPAEYTPPWIRETVEGKTVWLDTKSKMAWGPKLDIELSGMTQEDLELARSACEKETPVGSWALPTAAEFDIAKVNGILREEADGRHKWLTWQQVPPAIILPSVRGYVPASAGEKYSVRCIGRTLGAPLDGYLQADNETTLKALAE